MDEANEFCVDCYLDLDTCMCDDEDYCFECGSIMADCWCDDDYGPDCDDDDDSIDDQLSLLFQVLTSE